MHVGEKPYVVTTSASMYAYRGPVAWGHVELSSRVLTTDAVVGMLEQLLPVDQRKALDEYGAIEYALPSSATSSDSFTVVAARGGDDVWLEVRRTAAAIGAVDAAEPARADAAPPAAAAAAVAVPELVPIDPATIEPLQAPVEPVPAPVVADPEPARIAAEQEPVPVDAEPEPAPVAAEPEPVRVAAEPEPVPVAAEPEPSPVAGEPEPAPVVEEPEPATVAAAPMEEEEEAAPEPIAANAEAPFEIVEEEPQIVPTHAEVEALFTASAKVLSSVGPPVEPVMAVPEPAPELVPRPKPVEEPRHGVVLPLSRSPIASEPTVEVRTAAGTPLERVLKIAAARGAATVYVVARSQPVIRVDGEISVLDGEPALTAAEVERLVMDLAPARARDVAPAGEWMADVPDVGRVRCVTFRDHRGPGVIFRMIPPKAISADQLGIPPEVQALCAQPDGLVLVTGARCERQVDPAQCIRRSHQPDAKRPCDHDRIADRLRAREPAVVRQPARGARRQRHRCGCGSLGLPRGSGCPRDRGHANARNRGGGVRSSRVGAVGLWIGVGALDDCGAGPVDRDVPAGPARSSADVAGRGAEGRRRADAAAQGPGRTHRSPRDPAEYAGRCQS